MPFPSLLVPLMLPESSLALILPVPEQQGQRSPLRAENTNFLP